MFTERFEILDTLLNQYRTIAWIRPACEKDEKRQMRELKNITRELEKEKEDLKFMVVLIFMIAMLFGLFTGLSIAWLVYDWGV